MMIEGKIENHWYLPHLTFLTSCLLPLSWLFRGIVATRRFCYQKNIKKSYRFSVPIIVVGNITVGGTGKTPCVIWLANLLRAQGYKPGIVSRGVGGNQRHIPRWVQADSCVQEVGDEALLLTKRTQCPMVVCVDRVAAVKELLAKTDCNIVISDDGLQHYRLQRDFEIIMVDGMRGVGNRQLLPAGPLREPMSRLHSGMVILNGVTNDKMSFSLKDNVYEMHLDGEQLVSVKDHSKRIALSEFSSKKVHAVAAIGNPDRFFTLLRANGLDVIEHVFPDHYLFSGSDLEFADDLPVVMTEKDAVKCHNFVREKHWFIPVGAMMNDDVSTILLKYLSSRETPSLSSRGAGGPAGCVGVGGGWGGWGAGGPLIFKFF
jgi:tetraacyldisaccharide 4'-kinase